MSEGVSEEKTESPAPKNDAEESSQGERSFLILWSPGRAKIEPRAVKTADQ
jgi:hypothetical protein